MFLLGCYGARGHQSGLEIIVQCQSGRRARLHFHWLPNTCYADDVRKERGNMLMVSKRAERAERAIGHCSAILIIFVEARVA